MPETFKRSPADLIKPKRPDDFKTDEDFLKWVRTTFARDLEADRENREEALEDLKFFVGEQWEPDIEEERKQAQKPTLKLNRLAAFIAQLVGNRRLNEQVIKVLPDRGGIEKVAELRQEIVASVEKNSKASRVYDKAYENECACGVGNWQLVLEYADDDVFEQDIRIESIPNPLAAVWPFHAVDPTGADAEYVFVVDRLDKEVFKEKYPNATAGDVTTDTRLTGLDLQDGWVSEDQVQVVSVWRMRKEKRIVALLNTVDGEDQEVEDITDREIDDDIMSRLVVRDNGEPMIRETERRYAEMHVVTATDILSGPYRLPIQRVPVFRAQGWDVNVGERRVRFGLLRFLRDPQKLHNYWRSVVAEKLMRSPKASFIADAKAIKAYEKDWETAHTKNTPILKYDAEQGPPPVPVPPAQIEAALINEASTASQDIREISNISEASLGQPSNEVSGRAIIARQRVGEVGTAIYQDNLNAAIEECGAVIQQLIPVVYDTPRVLRLLGPDGKSANLVKINDTTDANSVDITVGKYSVSLTTGPSYVTRRLEAAESIMNMVNAMPQTMSAVADILVELSDWPKSDVVAARLRKLVPGNLLSEEEKTPEMKMAEQQQQATQQKQLQFQAQLAAAELAEKQARALESMARAQQAQAQAAKAQSEVGTKAYEVLRDAASDEFNQRINALKLLIENGE